MADNQSGWSVDSVSRRQVLATASAVGGLSIAGCSKNTTKGSNGLSGEVIAKGSSTVFPISDKMAQKFMQKHSNVNVTVDSTGSGGGFKNYFCPGDSDINAASRPIKPEEKSHCSKNNVNPIEMQIAKDALTMAVSPKNDWVDCLSFDQMAQIWKEGGAQKWSDLNSDWPDKQIKLFGPATTSGTFDWFNSNVIRNAKHRTDYEATEDDNIIAQGLEKNKYAIGYFGYAYYVENKDRVKALSVKKDKNGSCTKPDLKAAKDGSYPLARPLFIYVAKDSLQRKPVYEFVKFYIENSKKDWIADSVGYVPSSEKQAQENMKALKKAAGSK